MFDLDAWQEMGDVLRNNKLRTALTMAGVFWGMLMLLLMSGFGGGLEVGVQRTFGGWATNAVFLWGQRVSMPYMGRQPGRSVRFDNGDLAALRAEVQGIRHLCPRNQLGGWRSPGSVTRGPNTGSYQVMGDVSEYVEVQPVNMDFGRWINPLDLADNRKVAIIGRTVYEELFPEGGDPVGDHIAIQGVWFQVVGVFSSQFSGDQADRQNKGVHIPFTTFQQAFNVGDRIGWFALVAEDWLSAAEVEEQVRQVLAERHAIHPDDDPAIGSFNAEEEFVRMQNTFAGIRGFVWFVGLMTLATGVFGVSNIMLVAVRERTMEIGLRRALGATGGSVMAMILRESLLLTALAGLSGLVVGVGLLGLIGTVLGESNEVLGNPQVDFEVVVTAATALLVAGTLAGLLPAQRAAAIHPVEALRAGG